jgi:hypothetical protein
VVKIFRNCSSLRVGSGRSPVPDIILSMAALKKDINIIGAKAMVSLSRGI